MCKVRERDGKQSAIYKLQTQPDCSWAISLYPESKNMQELCQGEADLSGIWKDDSHLQSTLKAVDGLLLRCCGQTLARCDF